MSIHFPFDDIAKKVAMVNSPYLLSNFESIFLEISTETAIEKIPQKIDIQNEICDIYRITTDKINQQYLPIPPAYFYYRIQAVLLLSQNRFYILIHCGHDPILTAHTFNQNIAGLRTSIYDYTKISSGRFIDNSTGNFISAEEDEFSNNYFLITNSEWLLNSDEIFNLARNYFII
jgi:hypothetical protein